MHIINVYVINEIMIVVAIIGILSTIAIQNFFLAGKRSQKNYCIANLKLIESAVQHARFTNDPQTITMDTLVGLVNFIKSAPRCPTSKEIYVDLDPPQCPTLPDEHQRPTDL